MFKSKIAGVLPLVRYRSMGVQALLVSSAAKEAGTYGIPWATTGAGVQIPRMDFVSGSGSCRSPGVQQAPHCRYSLLLSLST